ncbi:substrate-binding domain-containing protein [Microbacterium sp. ASV49]|uniref:Substrate-binding domain-containing protein n=1 Tax=Microbacterium candidum TaxID=3041922 RepID=A0ABT7MXR3_9MICO|nr:substrate-binding domain-containing protein [Microbacterium sp. ASV49]MDL9979216.1 substrate-binding domain-containing protein [Microbacterium sp. ASV49]
MTDNGMHALLAPARRAHVLAELDRHGVVRISQLIDELGVSPVTLRRDLVQMEDEGLLVRIHGGAIPPAVVPEEDEPPAPAEPGPERTLAVLVPALNYYWPGIVRGMEQESRRRGVRLIVRAASYTLQDERPILERFVTMEGVDGLIVAPNTDTPHAQDVVQWLSECPVPSVLVEREGVVLPGNEPVESVTTDHALGAILAARHLASLGHRRVGLVISRDSPTSRKITQGWEAACAELGLTPLQHFESFLPERTRPEFSAVVDAALDTAVERGTTALLVHPDPEAMAFADLAVARGISVPEDLSIIAYDDEVAAIFSPALTAVRPPREALGAAAVDLLLRRIEDPARPVHRVTVSPRLNVRESTAPVHED